MGSEVRYHMWVWGWDGGGRGYRVRGGREGVEGTLMMGMVMGIRMGVGVGEWGDTYERAGGIP